MKNSKIFNWITAVVGLWLIVSPYILGYSNLYLLLWNSFLIGGLIVVISVVSALSSNITLIRALDWANVALSIWLYGSPLFLYQLKGFYTIYIWNALAVGFVVLFLEMLSLVSIQTSVNQVHS